MNLKNTFLKYSFLILLVAGASYARASIIQGTIDPTYYTAQICEDTNCTVTSTSPINFGHFTTAQAYDTIVTDSELTGFIWGTKFGYVVLNCRNTTSGCSSTNGNFKVANDKNGHLSGYAWGDTAGWINFGPFTNNTAQTVLINYMGQFNGYAWSQNFGWIKFDCSSASACVTTDWRPQAGRPQCSDGIDNDGNGYIDAADPACHTDGDVTNPSSYDPTINREHTQQFHPNYPVYSTTTATTPPASPNPIVQPTPAPTASPTVTPAPILKNPVTTFPTTQLQKPVSFPEFIPQTPQGTVQPVQPPAPQFTETHYLPSFLRAIGSYLQMVPAPDANTMPKMKGPTTPPQASANTVSQQAPAQLTFIQKVVGVTREVAHSAGDAIGGVLNSIGNLFNNFFGKIGK